MGYYLDDTHGFSDYSKQGAREMLPNLWRTGGLMHHNVQFSQIILSRIISLGKR